MDSNRMARVRRTVWAYYRTHGRHDLPWRKTCDPYRILVSEVMLQQTQVARVVPKYEAFLRRFPTARTLARAPLGDVLRLWQGLGYNRRAKALHEAMRYVVAHHKGQVPISYDALRALPSVGPYTAAAVCVFAGDEPRTLIETNIRTVLIAELLPERTNVSDAELHTLAAGLLSRTRSREWHWALMDYGAHLKAQGVRMNERSKHYTKQSPFAGSDREVRGAILKALAKSDLRKQHLVQTLPFERQRVQTQLDALVREGLVMCRRGICAL